MVPLGVDGDPDAQDGAHLDRAQKTPDGHSRRTSRYRMSADLAMLDGDFFVLNDAGEHEFRISSRWLWHDDTIQISDLRGHVLYAANVHSARKRDRIAISDESGVERVTVVRVPISTLRDRFCIEFQQGQQLDVEGSVSTHEYSIDGPSGTVAEISQRWFHAKGSYGVEVVNDEDQALVLTTVMVLDQMIFGVR
jgi:uncharacterized protein YxjI